MQRIQPLAAFKLLRHFFKCNACKYNAAALHLQRANSNVKGTFLKAALPVMSFVVKTSEDPDDTGFTPFPLVGVCADRKQQAPHWYHCAGEKYLTAVCDAAGAIPLIIPALEQHLPITALLDRLDGVLLTGAYSNLHPRHYGQQPAAGEDLRDSARDHSNLALIPAALSAGIPVLGICRGLQELNVALGGSLHQRVHEVAGLDDHRENSEAHIDEQYGPAHDVMIEPGGLLAQLIGAPRVRVNSVHGQGIDRLAPGLRVEARAPDGLVEAVSVVESAGFALALQWHPEWQVMDNPAYRAIFKAFGDACRHRARSRTGAD